MPEDTDIDPLEALEEYPEDSEGCDDENCDICQCYGKGACKVYDPDFDPQEI